MGAPNMSNEESLYRLLEDHGDNRVKRELLIFWGSHPNAKFARNTICYGLDCGKLEVDGALRALVKAGLVDEHILNNDVTFYSLTTNEERRQPVLELAALEWYQLRLMLKRIEQKDRLAKCQ